MTKYKRIDKQNAWEDRIYESDQELIECVNELLVNTYTSEFIEEKSCESVKEAIQYLEEMEFTVEVIE